MIRYQVKHDRDPLTHAGFHWNVYEVNTSDTHADPRCVAWGSYEAAITFATGMAMLRVMTGVRL